MKSIKIILVAVVFSVNALSQATPGVVNFNFISKAKSGGYSPKHVMATWIETDAGAFVKTLNLNGSKRKEYLYTWNSKSSGNTTDASTGATLASHKSHNLSWNTTAVDGSVVPDGEYKIKTEFTSEHAQGPILMVSFPKAGNEVSLTPDNQTYFETISLSFVPESSTGIAPNLESIALNIYPNPVKDIFMVQCNLDKTRDIQLNIYDSKMSLISNLYSGQKEKGEVEFNFNLKKLNLNAGVYYILLKTESFQSAQKIIYLP
ncbi:MAG: DUF2271 domain-containing protein [Bacteroidales bacterium]|nr:DUF2271 domain-containing protein [Bacteroidales bacterium]